MTQYKRKHWLWLVGLVAVLLVGCQSSKQTKQVAVDWPFYEIKKDDQVVGHILGTIHVGKKEMYPLPEEILTPLKNSRLLLTEVKESELGKADANFLFQFIEGKEPITTGMTEESLAIFRERLDENGYDEEQVKMKNRFGVTLNFQTNYISVMDTAYGVEKQLYSSVEKGSTIKNEGFETLAEQFGTLLETYKEPADVNEWVAAIPTLKKNKQAIKNLLADYIAGDVFKYYETTKENDMGPLQQSLLIDQRNAKWMNALLEHLNTPDVFVAVGAGHLPTEKGILHLLENEGYQTTKVSFK